MRMSQSLSSIHLGCTRNRARDGCHCRLARQCNPAGAFRRLSRAPAVREALAAPTAAAQASPCRANVGQDASCHGIAVTAATGGGGHWRASRLWHQAWVPLTDDGTGGPPAHFRAANPEERALPDPAARSRRYTVAAWRRVLQQPRHEPFTALLRRSPISGRARGTSASRPRSGAARSTVAPSTTSHAPPGKSKLSLVSKQEVPGRFRLLYAPAAGDRAATAPGHDALTANRAVAPGRRRSPRARRRARAWRRSRACRGRHRGSADR